MTLRLGNKESFVEKLVSERRKSWLEKLRTCYQTEITTSENGAYGIRTRDLLNAIEALYQLS